MKGTPTLRGRLLGLELRQAREAAGVTVADFAARLHWPLERVEQLEQGVSDSWPADLAKYRPLCETRWARLTDAAQQADQPEMWCQWGDTTRTALDVLGRTAERIDLFAPLGIHPAIEHLDPERCTAYVLESAVLDRTKVKVRVIPHSAGAYPGIEHHPMTYFRMPDGPAVVLYAYLHAAHFTQETPHLMFAYKLFDQLDEFVVAVGEP
ncbi:helix-turn-helix protein [Saccharothrix carnea]|uniref:Helix-turn-helix protein n=1 Tax=Saccharothrix carnea TaxID=1280637 RepID=A0A2P8I439_SACCR|nr:Scr1 family TA system antitoxin-like transcriptional regulator [Saccharothrix carnea]PSL53231.1 helix-turn-helix protein [Saccharothrix carnea]